MFFVGCHTSWDWKAWFSKIHLLFVLSRLASPHPPSVRLRPAELPGLAVSLISVDTISRLAGWAWQRLRAGWWNAITEQQQIPKENRSGENDEKNLYFCTVEVCVTVPKLIHLHERSEPLALLHLSWWHPAPFLTESIAALDAQHSCWWWSQGGSWDLHQRTAALRPSACFPTPSLQTRSWNFSWTLYSFWRETELCCVLKLWSPLFVCMQLRIPINNNWFMKCGYWNWQACIGSKAAQ